jgi:ABC-2 type transport system permease protein
MWLLLLSSSVKMIVRDRQSLFWALAFPVIFLAIFRLFALDSPGETELVVADPVQSEATRALSLSLDELEFLDVETRPDLDEASAVRLLDDNDADAVLLMRPREGDRATALLIYAIDDPIGSSVTIAAIESAVDGVNLALVPAARPLSFSSRSADVDDVTFFRFVGPGIIAMGLMTFSLIGLSSSLARYREEGVLRRLRATPLAPWRFFASVVGAHLIVATAQIVLLLLIAELLGATLLGSFAPFLVISLVGTVIFLNIAVIVAGLVEGRGAVESAANAVAFPMMFLSGTFFPTEGLPAVVARAVEVLPLTHMLRALRSVSLDGDSIVEQWPELLVMAGWVAVTFVAARWAFRLEDA